MNGYPNNKVKVSPPADENPATSEPSRVAMELDVLSMLASEMRSRSHCRATASIFCGSVCTEMMAFTRSGTARSVALWRRLAT